MSEAPISRKRLSILGQYLGIFGIILSLIFVGFELRQNTIAARNDSYNEFSNRISELLTNIASDERLSDLMAQINEGKLPEEFSTQDQLSIRYIQGAALRTWEGLFRSIQEGILPEELLDTIGSGTIVGNDYFKSTWYSTRHMYTEDFAIFFEGQDWNQ